MRRVFTSTVPGAMVAAATLAAAVTTPALAADTPPAPGTDIVLELGAAARTAPAYPGADHYTFSPVPLVKLRFLALPIFGTVADSKRTVGVGFYPAFNFEGGRSAADHSELTGLKKVNWAVELGAGVRYTGNWMEAFAEVRRGFNGHQGFVGEIGLDGLVHPSERLTVKFGPRLTLADSDYMSTYFSVSSGESAASGGRFTTHDAAGGIRDLGLALGAEYAATDKVTVYADAGYRRLMGDAADSPIVKHTGSADQFTAGLGLTYRFSWNVDGK